MQIESCEQTGDSTLDSKAETLWNLHFLFRINNCASAAVELEKIENRLDLAFQVETRVKDNRDNLD